MKRNRRSFTDGYLNGLLLKKDMRESLKKRRGIDVLHFKDGKIINKLTYSKTTIDIDGERVSAYSPR